MADVININGWYFGNDTEQEMICLLRDGESRPSGVLYKPFYGYPLTYEIIREAYTKGYYIPDSQEAQYEDIYAEHDSAKARVRNRRRENKKNKAKELPENRKRQKFERNWRLYVDTMAFHYNQKEMPVAEFKAQSAEKSIREDWESEQEWNYRDACEEKFFHKCVNRAIQSREKTIEGAKRRIEKIEKDIKMLQEYEKPTDWASLEEFEDITDWKDHEIWGY